MCGRGACTLSADRCSRVAGGARVRRATRLRPRYNLGPQGFVPVVTSGDVGARRGDKLQDAPETRARHVSAMKWGLVPSFAKRPEDYDVFKGGSSTFNARVEGVESSGLWRRLVDTQRGVVLFDGFYEWKTAGKSKVPMFIRNPDSYAGHVIAQPQEEAASTKCADESESTAPVLPVESTPTQTAGAADVADGPKHAPLMMAALYDIWHHKSEGTAELGGEAAEPLESATLLTMDSDGTPVAGVHDRMPVFLTPETAAAWLDGSVSFAKVIGPVLQSAQTHAKQLLIYEVAPLVSNVKNESADCVLPKKEYDAKQFSKGLGKFFAKKTTGQTSAPGAPPTSHKRPKADEGAGDTPGPLAKVARTSKGAEQAKASEPRAATVILLDD